MMKLTRIALLVALFASAPAFSAAPEERSTYEMRASLTWLSPIDVDYWSAPITLVRTPGTNAVHWVDFTVSRWTKICTYWENRCVQYDAQGRCVRWERVCAQWIDREEPVDKRIQLDFRDAAPLAGNEIETYRLDIQRRKPSWGQGEDEVRTWLQATSTAQPTVVRRWGDYSYSIFLKEE